MNTSEAAGNVRFAEDPGSKKPQNLIGSSVSEQKVTLGKQKNMIFEENKGEEKSDEENEDEDQDE